jgi:8-oxo-dGTP pyrophosphatase MutT (NUDIX family)
MKLHTKKHMRYFIICCNLIHNLIKPKIINMIESNGVDIRAASGVLIKQAGTDKYLLEYSNDRQAWQIPGGRLNKNESPYDALARELKEEISLNIENFKKIKLTTVDFRYDKKAGDSMLHFFFTAEYHGSLLSDAKVDNVEVNDFGLYTKDEVISILKDRYAAQRVQMVVDSPNMECYYLENAKQVF